MRFKGIKRVMAFAMLLAAGQYLCATKTAAQGNIAGSDIDLWIGDVNVCAYDIDNENISATDTIYDSGGNITLFRVYEDTSLGYKVYAGDGNSDSSLDTLYIRPTKSVLTLPGIRAYGHGDVVLYSPDPGDGTMNTEQSETTLTLDAYAGAEDDKCLGYAFYGDVTNAYHDAALEANASLVSSDDKITFSIRDGESGGGVQAENYINGTIKTTSFSAKGIMTMTFGTESKPLDNAFELSYGQEILDKDSESYYMVELGGVDATFNITGAAMKGDDNNAQNFKLVRLTDEAVLTINDLDGGSRMFSPSADMKLRVQNGGAVVLNSTAAMELPEIQAGYYTCKGTIEAMSDGEELNDRINIVSCEPGDFASAEGRYVYTVSDDGRAVELISCGRELYPLRVGEVEHGTFHIEEGTGIKAGGEYWLEAGTPVMFTLVPDSGYQYKKGTFNFLGGYAGDDDYVKRADKAGCYLYYMEKEPVEVSCEFERAEDEIKVSSAVIAGAGIDMGENDMCGSRIFTVTASSDPDNSQQSAAAAAAGDLYVSSFFELSMDSVINAVNNQAAWVTKITELDKDMTVTLKMDESMSGRTDYAVIRICDGTAEKIRTEYNVRDNSISFDTDRCSVYAIAYRRIDLGECMVSLSTMNYTYNGRARKPAVTVKHGAGEISADNYSVQYSNNVNAGTATVTIEARNTSDLVAGTVSSTYKIARASNKLTLTTYYRKTVSSKAQSIVLGVKAKAGTIRYNSNNVNVKVSAAGKVTIAKKFIGKAVITARVTDANYNTLSRRVTINVIPPKVSLKKLTNSKPSQLAVTWKKNNYATGYELQYSTARTFIRSRTKTVKVKGADKLTTVIKNLRRGRKYYVRIRAYRAVGKVNYYSVWSGAKYRILRK